eukprot:jgi/Chlat1/6331/Chrsp44S05891
MAEVAAEVNAEVPSTSGQKSGQESLAELTLRVYENEGDLPVIMALVGRELSEPYSIFTYRYFIHNWPHLCWLGTNALGECVAAIVCKADDHRGVLRGYIAMLVVDKPYRKGGLGTKLVIRCIEAMRDNGCTEVVLEAETSNAGALALYENLGFVRDKRLHRYYLNGADAFRLKLRLPYSGDVIDTEFLEDVAGTVDAIAIVQNETLVAEAEERKLRELEWDTLR